LDSGKTVSVEHCGSMGRRVGLSCVGPDVSGPILKEAKAEYAKLQ